MYTEIIKDNTSIIHALKESDIHIAVKNLKATRNNYILDFLSALCVCQAAAVHSHQHTICKALYESKENKGAVFDITFDASLGIVYVAIDGNSDPVPLIE